MSVSFPVGGAPQAFAALQLLRRFEARHGLALPEVASLAARVEMRALKPREAAFLQGEPGPHVYIVRSGLLKQLYTREDGSEWIKSFAGPNDLFACLQALHGREPASFSSVAMEPSIVERVDYRWIDDLADRHLAWQKALRLAFQRLAELKVQRERELLTMTPRELYARLREQSPTLLARVPQKDLAGFLGVTAVGLNRIVHSPRRGPGLGQDVGRRAAG